MSQSGRSHVLARVRWRKQAARLVAEAVDDDAMSIDILRLRNVFKPAPSPSVATLMVSRRLLDGGPFNVALVRSHCERLLADAERQSTDRVVFEDWTRDRGLGPDNRARGAFVRCSTCAGTRVLANLDGVSGLVPVGPWTGPMVEPMEPWRPGAPTIAVGVGEAIRCPDCLFGLHRGGWPGRLAREFGWERCSGCEGAGWVDRQIVAPPITVSFRGKPTRKRCDACAGRGRVRGVGIEPGFAAGSGIARTARRLLDTLDGRCPWAPGAGPQPSECPVCTRIPSGVTFATADGVTVQARPGLADAFVTSPGLLVAGKDGNSRVAELGEAIVAPCLDCRGTGHNLAGVLPRVDWP